MAKVPQLPVEAMFPAGAVAPYGRPSQGTNEQQEAGQPPVVANPDKNIDGSNPSIPDAPFANGVDIRKYGSSPNSNCEPGMPGAGY